MTETARETFDVFLEQFYHEQSLSARDRAILDYALDGWPMGSLAKEFRTTPGILHSRKRQLVAQMREFFEQCGIYASADIF